MGQLLIVLGYFLVWHLGHTVKHTNLYKIWSKFTTSVNNVHRRRQTKWIDHQVILSPNAARLCSGVKRECRTCHPWATHWSTLNSWSIDEDTYWKICYFYSDSAIIKICCEINPSFQVKLNHRLRRRKRKSFEIGNLNIFYFCLQP